MKRTIIAGAMLLALAACNPNDKLASCIAQGSDPRPFKLELGDIVQSSLYRKDMQMTVTDPVFGVSQMCDKITATVVAMAPDGTQMSWTMPYTALELVKTGAHHN